ncbi:thiolase family protein [Hymenobacter chitinivorans]|uniref:Acetyl-CoA acyltransferase n=1 Tax=Hymenobacter chitinivorans DSM 11115 TaxID=1121954 RepID=A0A2M9BNH0_9BACT|nr:thiolase family protein [Hymenobacter chitinivorans]PJJ59486.1 acetyl-CoA acyltransferase [Hymenobacter chitinivorans DSM 11115]
MNAYLLDFARTPFQFARKGAFAALPPAELAAQLVRGLLARQAFDPAELEDVLLGCAYPEGEQGDNLARIVALLAGLPDHVAGATINRFCGSSMTSIHAAAGSIATGAGEAFLCLGVESMTKVPQGGLHPAPNPRLQQLRPEAYIAMGLTAENVARRYNISREAQEEFAAASQAKAVVAAADAFADELLPVTLPDGTLVTQDGCLRPATSLEGLAALKPAFAADGTVTAGTSSPLTDGAAAVLVVSEAFLRRHNLTPLAQLRAVAVAGVAPEVMGLGPVPATGKALARAGLGVADIDVVELNEAFAAQALACQQELGLAPAKLNLDGGALALGHPLGATGARITGKAASLLRRTGGRYALATQCIGGGQGIATVLERC